MTSPTPAAGSAARGADHGSAPRTPERPHALPLPALREALGLSESAKGLSAAEAAERLERFGRNVLPTAPPVRLSTVILHQFLSPLIYILLAAAAVALALGDVVDAGFILLVVAVNAALGTYQEWRAERSAAALQQLITTRARVRRAEGERSVPAEELVPGDLVLLESGNRVPADLRLLRETGLLVDESFLTGESVAVEKQLGESPPDAAIAERRNMAFAGSIVTSGRAEGWVVATGVQTQVGAIAASVALEAASKSPLVQRMERLARQISLAVLVAIVGLAAVALSRGVPASEVFFLAVALAVSAIPEGLPVAVTVALSIATSRMARRNVIVRRLTAVEGLGSCTIIASDKTGTLTVNRQTVRRVALPAGPVLEVTGEGYSDEGRVMAAGEQPMPASDHALAERLARCVVRCNEARLVRQPGGWESEGDAVDIALLALGLKLGIAAEPLREAEPLLAELPFESERAFAAAVRQTADGPVLSVKGAIEAVLPRCHRMAAADGEPALDVASVEAEAGRLAEAGYRFLAVAEARLPADSPDAQRLDEGALPPLTLLGLVGLMDPPRPEAAEAVAQCRAAGVAVAMVTGDHPRTALAVARELGIATDDAELVTGRELLAAGEGTPAFQALAARGRVFARVAPLQKLQLVEALQAAGHYVAVTGDGVNDAPALKRANIGVAMGSGSDVTKDTAALIVTDDNFASIEAGVEEGRFAYDNIRKVTALLISTGAAEVLLFLVALLLGLPLPLLAVQLLWLNLVTNGIQDVALAFEAGEAGAMQKPPRKPTEGIFNKAMIQQTVLAGVTMGAIASAFWVAELQLGVPEESARNQLLMLFVLMQNVHAFNCRSEQQSVFRVPLSRNWMLVGGVAAALGLHVLSTFVPLMQRLLGVSPLRPLQFLTALILALGVMLAMEGYKAVLRRRAPARREPLPSRTRPTTFH